MRTLIIDDEASARARLRRLLAAHAEIELVGEAFDGLEATLEIEQLKPDLVFLDVQMPGRDGFEVLRALRSPPLIIFATAYDEYALAAFEANAVGYLLKPVARERLAASIERARQLACSASERRDEAARIAKLASSTAGPLEQIVASRGGRLLLLPLAQIVFLRVEHGILRAHTADENYATDYQINEVARRLPDPPFFRAHRSAIVNLRRVREIVREPKSVYSLIMHDAAHTEIAVSERNSQRLRKRLGL
ncbi:MAG: response regulator transcription factor [Acidobacteria bacterium]|nr:response regulator transcription factor [Acidobacteriota bacterium]